MRRGWMLLGLVVLGGTFAATYYLWQPRVERYANVMRFVAASTDVQLSGRISAVATDETGHAHPFNCDVAVLPPAPRVRLTRLVYPAGSNPRLALDEAGRLHLVGSSSRGTPEPDMRYVFETADGLDGWRNANVAQLPQFPPLPTATASHPGYARNNGLATAATGTLPIIPLWTRPS